MHYPCPICGKVEGRRGRPFEDPYQTASHIDGAHDYQHREQRGEEWLGEIEDGAVPPEESGYTPPSEGAGAPAVASEPVVSVMGDELAVSAAVEILEARATAHEESFGELLDRLDAHAEALGELAVGIELATDRDLTYNSELLENVEVGE